MDLRIKGLKQLLSSLADFDIDVFEYEQAGERIKISRRVVKASVGVTQEIDQEFVDHSAGGGNQVSVNNAQECRELHTISAPIVGTFYRAPAPGAPPFIEEGALVQKGSTLCIIEAMKLMNEIESDINGKVISILVDNGQPVEYGTPLMLIEPQ